MAKESSFIRTISVVVTAVLIAVGVSLSWILAIQSKAASELRRDAPSVLGSTVLINQSVQDAGDALTESLKNGPDPEDIQITTELDDGIKALEGLIEVVKQADEKGLGINRNQLLTALAQNRDYFELLRSLVGGTVLEMDETAIGQLPEMSDTTRETLAAIFDALRVSPNPYQDEGFLSSEAVSTSLGQLHSIIARRLDNYMRDVEAVSTFESEMEVLAARYFGENGLRNFDSSSIIAGLGHKYPAYYEYSTARRILRAAARGRQALINDLNLLIQGAPSSLAATAVSFRSIIELSLSGINSAQTAVDEYEDDQTYEPCYRYVYNYYYGYTYRYRPCYKSIVETDGWTYFDSISAQITDELELWAPSLPRALDKVRAKLEKRADALRPYGAKV